MTNEGFTKIINFMTTGAEVLVLGHDHTSHIETKHYSLKKSSLLPDIDQTNYVYSNDDQGRVYQNCNFHDPQGRCSCAREWPYVI